MAEFNNAAANLGLYHEIFNLRTPREELAVTVEDVNNVGDVRIKKHSHSSGILDSSILNCELDSGIRIQTNCNSELEEDSSYEDSVRLHNIENLRKKAQSSNSVIQSAENNKTNVGGNEKDSEQTNCVNGTATTVLEDDPKQCMKKKKGVTFPKDTIISGYLDPPDPWKNAPPWTTDELVAAYKKSCEFLGAKPIHKLIQQLLAINPLGKREESLILKGEKLDQKQCECLEEILKRVQFKLLDLESSHLDDESAVALFDMIEYYESACQLSIAFNKNIQARGWQACARLIRRTPSLNCLDIRNCDLNERTIPIFGRALKLGCHLTILHMENMNLSGRPLLILVAALKVNTTLQELFLSENKLMPTDGVQLGNLLCYNHRLSLLDLRNNHLQDIGTKHISEGLMEQKKGTGLRTLVLWNNSINYQAMAILGRALASSQNLETLNIGHNAITNEGVHQLKDGLLRVNSLLRLGLQGTKISDEGAVALAEYIAETTVLLRIDLRDNDIKTGGLMALSHAMRVNISVTRIDLDKEPKKESGMKDYFEQQSRLLRDVLTYQQRNVEIALNREEQERIKLQEKAETEAAASRKEADTEQQTISIPSNTSTESFTLIEDLPDQETAQKKEESTFEIDTAKITVENLTEEISTQKPNGGELESPVYQHDEKPVERPSTLGLSGEVAIISSKTVSDLSPKSQASEPVNDSPPLSISPSQTGVSTVTTCSTPAEMILSPQYFPKQIARKIFSVIRVQEDLTCHQLSSLSPSSTPPLAISGVDDHLNVSPLLLISVSSSHSSLVPSLMPVIKGAEKEPLHLRTALQVASPGASLFQDLAEETIKHMVSPDTDIPCHTMITNHQDCTTSFAATDNHKDNHENSYKATDTTNYDHESSFNAPDNVKDSLENSYHASNTIRHNHENSLQLMKTTKYNHNASQNTIDNNGSSLNVNDSIKGYHESLYKTKDSTKEDQGITKDNASETDASSHILESHVAPTESFTSLEGDSLPMPPHDKDTCNNLATLLFEDTGTKSTSLASKEWLGSYNSVKDNSCLQGSMITEKEHGLTDTMALLYKLPLSGDGFGKAQHSSEMHLSSQVCKLEQLCTDASQVGSLKHDLMAEDGEAVFIEGAGNGDAKETDIFINDVKAECSKQFCDTSCDSLFFSVEEDTDSDTALSIGKGTDRDVVLSVEKSSYSKAVLTVGKSTGSEAVLCVGKSSDSDAVLSVGNSAVGGEYFSNGGGLNNDTIFSIAESANNVAIFSIEDSSDSTVIDSEALLVKTDKDAVHPKQDSSKERIFQDGDSGHFQSVMLSNEISLSPMVNDLSMPVEPESACLNNFSSPSLLLPENAEELSPVCLWERSDADQFACGDFDENSFSSIVDLITPGSVDSGEMKDRKADALIQSLGASSNNSTYDSLDNIVSINNVVNDNTDIENEDFTLVEEPWLTVGIDCDGIEAETSKKPSKQPDFFTTLSLNGLTQELASALTSLDGSTSPFGVDGYDSDL